MSFRLLPKDVKFFDLFVEDGENLQVAAVALRDMLDHFEARNQIVFSAESLDTADAIIDRETLAGGVIPGRLDILGRRIDRGHLRAQPGKRFRKQSGAAADIGGAPILQWPEVMLVEPPMLVDPVAPNIMATP